MSVTTDPLDALLAVRDGYTTARWNFADAVGSPVAAPAGMGNAVTLSYSFLAAVPSYFTTSGFRAFTAAEQAATRDVLAVVSAVARVGFTEVAGVGTLTFGMNAQGGGAGYAYYPGFGYTTQNGTILSVTAADVAGDVWLDSTEGWTAADFARGGLGHGSLLHEVLHALGLKHPFESTPAGHTLDAAHDHKGWTVMSYTPHPHGLLRTVTDNGGSTTVSYRWVEPETPMPYDILALRSLYGANAAVRSGNDTYTFDPARPFIRTIVDAGGSDTISVANFARGCTIDLRDGRFSSITIPSDPLPDGWTEPNDGIYDGTDNLAIAFGTWIENATGGAGADRLVGNALANVLNGGGGNDTMTGGDGSDTYHVAQAGDVVVEAGTGTDLVLSWRPSYTLGSSVENGRVMSTAAASLTGNGLANLLDAGAGDNLLDGGAGTDTASWRYAAAAVQVNLSTTGAQATGGSGSDTLRSIENLNGSPYADRLSGNAGANRLDGGAGADTLTGGDGPDIYVIDHVGDRVIETNALAAGGIDLVQSTLASTTLGPNVENGRILAAGTAAMTGNDLGNVIHAGAGANALNGGGGIDTLSYAYAGAGVTVSLAVASAQATGGSGSDTIAGFERVNGSAFADRLTGDGLANRLAGAAGNDTLAGGAGNDTLLGGIGRDSLAGGAGSDSFDWDAVAETGLDAATRDLVTDFVRGQDRLDLAGLDANAALAGDQAFTSLIAAGAGFSAAGQLRFAAGVLWGNTDADASAEFSIALAGVGALALGDIVL